MPKADIVAAQKAAILSGQDAALESGLELTYDGAFSEGVASVPPADAEEQAKIDAAVAAAVGPLNDQIVALQAQDAADVASLQAAQGSLAGVQQQLSDLSAKEAGEAALIQGLTGSIAVLQDVVSKLQAVLNPPPPDVPVPPAA